MAEIDNELEVIQGQIAQYIGLSADQLIFSFKQKDAVTRLDLITISPIHDQSFLFHTTKATDKKDALQKMLEYIKQSFSKEDTYTIQWKKIGDQSLHTSYFRGKLISEILEKFYYERDENSYKIYSVILNPIS
jgi:hypothetical protein